MRKGFTLIELMIVIAIIAIIAAIAIPNLLRARAAANEASAISTLRTLVSANAMFYQGDIEQDDSYDYATSLAELSSTGMVDDVVGEGTKAGYRFAYVATNTNTEWNCVATPISTATGRRSFYCDQTGVVRAGVGGVNSTSPALDQ